jgi:hypothetical protein
MRVRKGANAPPTRIAVSVPARQCLARPHEMLLERAPRPRFGHNIGGSQVVSHAIGRTDVFERDAAVGFRAVPSHPSGELRGVPIQTWATVVVLDGIKLVKQA